MSEWLTTNELIKKLNKGKTETLLFGTPQKISKNVDHFSVSYNDTPVVKTSNYVYLGVKLDGSLNLNSHFEKCYKRASSRLRLLSKLRKDLDRKAALSIYQSMIMPVFTYCGVLFLSLTKTQNDKLQSLHRRAENLTNQTACTINVRSITNSNRKHACILVKQCLQGKTIEQFQDYFKISNHRYQTQNNAKMLKLPVIKTEYARK